MSVVGEAVIKLVFDGKQAKGQLDETERSAKAVFSKIGSGALGAGKAIAKGIGAGLATASAAVVKITKDSVKAQAEFEQLWGGVATLYGSESAMSIEDFAKKQKKSVAEVEDAYYEMVDNLIDVESMVRDNANEAYRTAGLSMNQYMEQATTMAGALVQSLGGDTAKAAKVADKAIIDMSDNANKMGTDIQAIQNAYQGFSKQNYTMLDNLKLGYGGTRTEMQRLLKDAEKISGIKYDISSYADIVEAIHVVQKNMNITGTTAREAGATIQGSIGMAKASWQNLMTVMANDTEDIEPYIDNLVKSIFGDGSKTNKGVIGNALPAIMQALKSIGKAIPRIVKEITKYLPPLIKEILPPLIESAVTIFVAIAEMLPEITPILADGLVMLIEALIPYLPTIIGAFINAIIRVVKTLLKSLWTAIKPALKEVLNGIMSWFSGVANSIGNWFSGVFGGVKQAFANVVGAIGGVLNSAVNKVKAIMTAIVTWIKAVVVTPIANIFKGLWNGITAGVRRASDIIKSIVGRIKGFFNGLWNGVKSGIKGLLGIVKNIMISIGGAIKAPINAIIDAINRVIDKINAIQVPDWVPGIGGKHTNFGHIPRLAQGGVVTDATTAVIGEAGREAVIPLQRNVEDWATPMANAIAKQFESEELGAGRDINVYMTNNINNNLDADEIGRRLMTSIRRAA